MHLETSDFDIIRNKKSPHLEILVWGLSVPASFPGACLAGVPAFPWDSLLALPVQRVVWDPSGGLQLV